MASPAHAGIDPCDGCAVEIAEGFPRARGDRPLRKVYAAVRSALPPRTRGSTPSASRPPSVVSASPAHAGIDHLSDSSPLLRSSFPRARGDRPSRRPSTAGRIALPPRTRGSTQPRAPRAGALDASPAHAGIDLSAAAFRSARLRFPRARGDRPVARATTGHCTPLPPRTRGSTPPSRHSRPPARASPAHAGIDLLRAAGQQPPRGFPRARGDRPLFASLVAIGIQLPPRTRGSTVDGIS